MVTRDHAHPIPSRSITTGDTKPERATCRLVPASFTAPPLPRAGTSRDRTTCNATGYWTRSAELGDWTAPLLLTHIGKAESK